MPTQKLKTKDKMFEVDRTMIAKMSKVIGSMLRDLDLMDDEDEEPVPLDMVDGEAMEVVIQWCTFHQHDPPPPDRVDMLEMDIQDICPFDRNLLNVPKPLLYKTVFAANYLDIPGLMTTCCKTIANEVKGKSTEELRKIFLIKNDFASKQEEMEVCNDLEWTQW